MVSSAGTREAFGTRAGFILAAAGSAVGLGNMWRFAYQASEGGGAAFVLLYIGMTIILGIPLMLAEFGIGRAGRRAPVGALRSLAGTAWGRLGWLFAIGPLLILSYYSVIAGWTVRYAIESVAAGFPEAAAEHFGDVASGGSAIGFHLAFMAVTLGVVMAGVKGGIERASLILMPALFFIVVGLAVWAMTLSGGGPGYRVYLQPELSALSDPGVWRAAAAQSFFSLSLGMGAMITFASYLERTQNLPESAAIVSFTDFGVAFVSGLVVFPVVYGLGLEGAVSESTVGALFIALPGAFQSMGLVGHVVGLFFFIVLAVGALTSAISLLEVTTSSVIDEFGLPRKAAAGGVAVIAATLGLLPATNLDALGLMDKIAGEFALVVGTLLIAIAAGWVAREKILAELCEGASPFWCRQVPRVVTVLRFVVPVLIAIVLVTSLRETVQTVRDFLAG